MAFDIRLSYKLIDSGEDGGGGAQYALLNIDRVFRRWCEFVRVISYGGFFSFW